MDQVFKINEELASVAVTSTELLSVTRITVQQITNNEFIHYFSEIIREINKSYAVVDELFSPFIQLNNEELFIDKFDITYKTFKDKYLVEISKPRKYCDNIYESYVEMQQTKEAKTRFPLIRNNFIRLDKLYDKWINNDCYLGMSIDRAVKLENNLLNEISKLKTKDTEDAYFIFKSAFQDFSDYLKIIQQNNNQLNQLLPN